MQAAKNLISGGADWITQMHGPEEARHILQPVGSTEEEALNPGYRQDANAPSHSRRSIHTLVLKRPLPQGQLIAAGVATPARKRGD